MELRSSRRIDTSRTNEARQAVGPPNALHPLTVLDSTRVRPAIEEVEGRAPLCAVGALLLPDSDAIGQLIRVIERKVRHVVVAQFRQREAAGLLALRVQE
jgi:hypothetical protein